MQYIYGYLSVILVQNLHILHTCFTHKSVYCVVQYMLAILVELAPHTPPAYLWGYENKFKNFELSANKIIINLSLAHLQWYSQARTLPRHQATLPYQ